MHSEIKKESYRNTLEKISIRLAKALHIVTAILYLFITGFVIFALFINYSNLLESSRSALFFLVLITIGLFKVAMSKYFVSIALITAVITLVYIIQIHKKDFFKKVTFYTAFIVILEIIGFYSYFYFANLPPLTRGNNVYLVQDSSIFGIVGQKVDRFSQNQDFDYEIYGWKENNLYFSKPDYVGQKASIVYSYNIETKEYKKLSTLPSDVYIKDCDITCVRELSKNENVVFNFSTQHKAFISPNNKYIALPVGVFDGTYEEINIIKVK